LRRNLIEHTLLLFFYLLFFYFLFGFLNLPASYAGLITIFIIIASFVKLNHFIRDFLNRHFFLYITSVEKSFNEFNTQISRSIDFDVLLSSYSELFENIFNTKLWAFYIYEEHTFRLQENISEQHRSKLPSEIPYTELSIKHNVIKLRQLKSIESINLKFDLASFKNQNLDVIVSIHGKNQLIALLFTTSRNITFFYDKTIGQLANKILRKSGQILENAILNREVIFKDLQIKKLFEVTQEILSSLDSEKILDFILESLYDIITFDAAVIFLLDPDSKKLYKKVSKGYNASVDLTLKLGQGACGWVAQSKKTSLLQNVHKSRKYYPARHETLSQIALPLQIQDEVMGVLCLESDQLGHFTIRSQDILQLFANQAAIALNNAKQYEISLAKKSLEHELVNAGKVQKVLLPEQPPVIQNLNISFSHIASKIVSGDLFDLFTVDEKKLGIMIGDVSGKGAQAAIMMSLLLAAFRAYKKTYLAVCEVVARLNNLLEESISTGHFATFFYALISTKNDTITYTNAGHNTPILIKADGSVQKLAGGGMVLGFLANEIYTQKSTPFKKGDTLICYTDGISEAMDLNDIEFGEERFLQVLRKNIDLKSYDLKKIILEEIRQFTKRDDFIDDLTIIVVKYC
jgi:serine phosphatase RsbU (regulator of sigma subunit)